MTICIRAITVCVYIVPETIWLRSTMSNQQVLPVDVIAEKCSSLSLWDRSLSIPKYTDKIGQLTFTTRVCLFQLPFEHQWNEWDKNKTHIRNSHIRQIKQWTPNEKWSRSYWTDAPINHHVTDENTVSKHQRLHISSNQMFHLCVVLVKKNFSFGFLLFILENEIIHCCLDRFDPLVHTYVKMYCENEKNRFCLICWPFSCTQPFILMGTEVCRNNRNGNAERSTDPYI